jgi:AraC-like DNA-binding protein
VKLIGHHDSELARNAIASERSVSMALRTHFSKTWHLTIPRMGRPRRYSLIPDGCAELAWIDETLCILGPTSTARTEIALPGTTSVALRFKPGAAPAWLGISAGELVDSRLILEKFDDKGASELYEAIGDARDPETIAKRMEGVLRERAPRREVPNPCLGAVLELLDKGRFTKGRLVRDLQNLTNLSERSVRRETERFFGHGPKMLERIVRLQHFLQRVMNSNSEGLAALAAAAGYSDQSHLTREARDLTGFTPKMLLASVRLAAL